MTSHRVSLRLAPLRGGVASQRAANDVLRVKPCAGLMGPEGPGSSSCRIKNISDKPKEMHHLKQKDAMTEYLIRPKLDNGDV